MSFQLFVGGLGGPELVIVFLLVVLLFGANKLPKLARASGEAMSEFERGRAELENDIRNAADAGAQTDATAADADRETDLDADADHETDVDRGAPSA
ncbi:twin-arginine translocase TatA/TatE family subunit [Halorubellus sp. JP-L1]|uniref:twin-arginine translocase TatA/TatE family subunit n=1 Tax=Halorubellus sp. JP-L1 TaxID=2715753 RepID=UPI00140BCE67|nr:twin-arginine translocase TatA/TatE family subunit [Halorubellus sp. JP-L1]NHN41141.1 twin-arginine translocase TatA/TatE family subunit [Halorubellus sp. JP-L1]